MAGRSDKVQERMDTVIIKPRVTLDTRLLGENIVVLALEVARDLLEAIMFHPTLVSGLKRTTRDASLFREPQLNSLPRLIVNLVTETGGIDDSQGNPSSLLLKLCIAEFS